MSYDLYAVPIGEGEDPLEAWERLMDAEEAELDRPAPRDPAKERRKEELAAALTAAFPELERFEVDYAEIARAMDISDAEAHVQYRHIELNTPEGDEPIQIHLADDSVAANVPYWHDDERARRTYERLFAMLRVVQARTGWTIFDPQLEQALDLDRDLDAVLAQHAEGVGVTREIVEQEARTDRGGFLRGLFRR